MQETRQAGRRPWRWAVLLGCVLGVYGNALATDPSPVVTTRVEGNFVEILHSVRSAIQGKGINIAHTLPASGMLNRTGRDFGVRRDAFLQAEIVEFCSARISHKLIQANPENIVLCPFSIGVYVPADDPGHVYLTYRKPYVLDQENSRQAAEEMSQLLESIIEEVTW